MIMLCFLCTTGAKSKLSSRATLEPGVSKHDAQVSSSVTQYTLNQSHGMREDPTSPRRLI